MCGKSRFSDFATIFDDFRVSNDGAKQSTGRKIWVGKLWGAKKAIKILQYKW